MTRCESRQGMLYDLGAVPVVADALDPVQVAEAVARARPEVIVHQLAAIGTVDTREVAPGAAELAAGFADMTNPRSPLKGVLA
jgi:dTDP-4-dehydrorhamnose reductase